MGARIGEDVHAVAGRHHQIGDDEVDPGLLLEKCFGFQPVGGLSYLLEVNPSVKIYTPQEGAFFERAARFLAWARRITLLSPVRAGIIRHYGGMRTAVRWA